MCPNTLSGNNNWGEREPDTAILRDLSSNETNKFKQSNVMQHYNKNNFPLLFLCPKLAFAACCVPLA
jgi:hypothetical protein